MSFLNLPAEIRLYIYELSLTDLIETTPCPCVKTPRHRFATFWSLSLTSREIHAEVTALFRKKYIDKVYIYFDDIIQLHDFYQYAYNRDHLSRLHFCLRFGRGSCIENLLRLRNGNEYTLLPWDNHYPCREYCDELQIDAELRLCWTEPGFLTLFKEFEIAKRRMYGNARWNFPKQLPQLHAHLSDKFVLRETYEPLLENISGGENVCYTLTFPLSERGLQFSVHEGRQYILERPSAEDGIRYGADWRQCYMRELRGRLKDLTFRGIDMDLLKSSVYHGRDSAWQPYVYPPSPDLDEEERLEMDADSWGVPDRRSSEGSEDEDEDEIEPTWRLFFRSEEESDEEVACWLC